MAMTYKVAFTSNAKEDLSKLDRIAAQHVLLKISWLAENFDSVKPEALTGEFKGLFKLKSGAYRILYSANINDHTINIHRIGHRRIVYHQK